MAAALGITFFDRDGRSFVPAGGTLSAVSKIECSRLDQRIGESEFTVMSDVTNPLYGPLGAAYIYAPQKGATKEEVAVLDTGLIHVAEVIERDCQAMLPEVQDMDVRHFSEQRRSAASKVCWSCVSLMRL